MSFFKELWIENYERIRDEAEAYGLSPREAEELAEALAQDAAAEHYADLADAARERNP